MAKTQTKKTRRKTKARKTATAPTPPQVPDIRVMPLRDLHPAPYNPRHIDDAALEGLRHSMVRFGVVEPIIWNRQTGHVVGGHQRLKVLEQQGAKETRVVVVDLPAAEERALNVALNNPHISGEFSDGLEDLLAGIAADTPDLMEELRLGELFADGGLQAMGDGDDEIPEPPKNPVTKAGDLWTLGQHRLLCGDCRDPKDVARLLDGRAVNVAITSPPYASQRKYDENSDFKPIHPDEYVDWFDAVQTNIAAHLADDGSWFLNIKEHCEDGQRHLYVKDLTLAHVRRWGWMFVDEFCWRNTRDGVPGGWNNRLKNAWEPVFHFSRTKGIKFRPEHVLHETAGAFEYSPQNQKSTTGSGLLGSERAKPLHEGMARPSNVIECASESGRGEHSAPFPVGLPTFFIKAFSDEGDAIYDPFLGSGTTLIAAEQLDRACYGVEISEAYVDIIVERWEQATGGKATREKAT